MKILTTVLGGLFVCLLAACVGGCGSKGDDRDTAGADGGKEGAGLASGLSGDYLGQTPPGATPVLFAPGVVSTGLYERDVAMTPDGNELYFGLLTDGEVMIAVSKRENGVWSPPEIAPFCDDAEILDLEPHITPDGRRFLFLSTRPGEGKEKKPGWSNQDIWAMDRTPEGWSKPYNLGAPICTDAPEYFPSVTREGTIYFTREVTERERSLILRARKVDGGYAEPEILPEAVNPGNHQFNAFIDPDERYLIVGIAGREGSIGMADYYVCFRGEDDSWTGPINMGTAINTPGNRVVSPYVSPDGKYFFFASNRSGENGATAARRDYETIQRMASEPQNGSSDIYWVEAAFIEGLRP
jgi:hypothetical protein